MTPDPDRTPGPTLDPVPEWSSPSSDPNDETFGDVVVSEKSTDLDDLSERLAGLDKVDIVLVGEPFDAAVIGRRGAAEGPEAVRNSLAGVNTNHVEAGPIGDDVRFVDVGNVAVGTSSDRSANGGSDATGNASGDDSAGGVDATDDPAAIQEAVAEVAAVVHDSDALPVFLGGDNSLSYGNVRPLLDRGSVGVVNIDAHLDVREVRDTPTNGTPYRQLFDDGLDGYVCVGARHFETSDTYVEYVHDRGGRIVTAEAVDRDLDDALDRMWHAIDDVDTVYVSLDCDVLDASAAPGVSAPTPGGLTSRELFRLIRRLAADDRVAGFEIVECAPPLDDGGRTSDIAARSIAQFVARYVEGRDGGW